MEDTPTTTPRVLDPQAVRRDTLIDVDLGDGRIVRARKIDLSLMLMEGELPLTLLAAARALIGSQDEPPEERLDEATKDGSLAQLRRHAFVVVVEPVITMLDDGEPTHLPVTLLTLPQLLAIWNQTAIMPKVSAAQAADFRDGAGRAAPAVLLAGQDVRPTAQRVARTELDYRGA
jgi:hypothetical protein